MIRRPDVKADQIYNDFAEKIRNVLDELDNKYEELKKAKETERTFAFWTDKIINTWFIRNGT